MATYTYLLTKKNIQAKQIRMAIAKLYETHPSRAVAHVNAELAEASRQEENRQNLLLGLD